MFFAIILVAVGVALLLNVAGVLTGSFWGVFWGVFFIVVGIKMMMKGGNCPICGWYGWGGKMHNKMHEKMGRHCCDHEHYEEDVEETQK